jgi:carbonic anhydrase
MNARPTPARAIDLLKAGNARFASGAGRREPYNPGAVRLTQGQSPFAVVLGCSDSRVPVETVFDQLPGSIFAVRIAGNFLNDDNLGSIEFAVSVLKVPLIVVLGHGGCGAIGAALAYVRDGTKAPGHIQRLVEAVAPAVRETKDRSGEWLDNAVARNVERNVTAMTTGSRILADAVDAGETQVIGGIYDLGSGTVAFG